MTETIVTQKTEYPDSIEFGKAGNRCKLYINADDPEGSKARANNILATMRHMQDKAAENVLE